MAEGGRDFLSIGMEAQTESDSTFTFDCDPCRFDKAFSEGVAYCEVCSEFLCNDCWRAHRSSRLTRRHSIVTGDDLPRVRPKTPPTILEYCTKHRDMVVEFYCPVHDVVFCSTCKGIAHMNCNGTQTIDELCSNTQLNGGQFQDLADEISDLLQRFRNLKDDKQKELERYEREQQTCHEEISSFREKLDALSRKLEKAVRDDVDRMASKEKDKVKGQLFSIDKSIATLEVDSERLKATILRDRTRELFIAKKQIYIGDRSQVEALIRTETKPVALSWKAHPTFLATLEDMHWFGRVSSEEIQFQSEGCFSGTEEDSRLPVLNSIAVIPAPSKIIVTDLHPDMVTFLKKSTLYRTAFEKEMVEKNASVEWPTKKGIPLLLNFDAPEDKKNAAMKPKEWEACCRMAVDDFVKPLVVQDIPIPKHVWKEVLEKLGDVNIAHPDGVAVVVSKNSTSLSIVGGRQLVAELVKQVKEIITSECYKKKETENS